MSPAPTLRLMTETDIDSVVQIYRHFILNSFAAYPTRPIEPSAMLDLFRAHPKEYPAYVVEIDNKVVGFGELRPIHRADTLRRTAEIGYFFLPESTGHGLGTLLLDRLTSDARGMGVDNLIASISSRNEQSISFHLKHGFIECGRFKRAGRKFDQDFDIVWMQKIL